MKSMIASNRSARSSSKNASSLALPCRYVTPGSFDACAERLVIYTEKPRRKSSGATLAPIAPVPPSSRMRFLSSIGVTGSAC